MQDVEELRRLLIDIWSSIHQMAGHVIDQSVNQSINALLFRWPERN